MAQVNFEPGNAVLYVAEGWEVETIGLITYVSPIQAEPTLPNNCVMILQSGGVVIDQILPTAYMLWATDSELTPYTGDISALLPDAKNPANEEEVKATGGTETDSSEVLPRP